MACGRLAVLAVGVLMFGRLSPAADVVIPNAGGSVAFPTEVDVVVAGGTEAGIRAALKAKAAGRRVFVAAPRPYLGEDRAGAYLLEKTVADDPSDPLVRAMFDPATRADAAWKMPEDRLGVGLAYKLAEAIDLPRTPPDKDGLLPRTTPLEIKRAFDRALLDAKIPFLTGVGVIGIRRDASGRLEGVVVNGRDGSRLVRCSALVDATVRGKIAELAGGVRKPFPKGMYVFRCAFIHEFENFELTWRTFEIPMADGSAESFQAADNFIRDAIAPKDYVDRAECAILPDPPDVFTALPADVTVVGPCAPKGKPGTVAKPVAPADPAELEYDVVVVGVGTSGSGAAVGASRQGAKTLAVDFMPLLGGVGSEGRICGYYDGNICGFTLESDAGREALGGVYYHAQSEWFRREIRAKGGTVWFATVGIGALKEGCRVAGVVLRMADGTLRRVRAKVVVDATGNADVAAQAGAQTEFINGRELSLQGAGLAVCQMYTLSVNSDIGFVDDTSAEAMSNFALRSRLSALTALWNASSLVDSRERRRIVGDYTLRPVDIMLERTFPDTVCRANSRFDTHGQTEDPLVPNVLEGDAHRKYWANEPYRILLPKGVEGLLVTGLGLSAHRDAMPVVRMQAEMRNLGYAVGVAAAMCAADGITPRQLDVKRLQRHLVAIGQLPGSVLTAKDSFPYRTSYINRAARSLVKSLDELPMIFHDPVRGRAEVARAYAVDGSVNQAFALALLGDSVGVGQLVANIARGWDAGWNYKGMSQYGSSLSMQDRYILAIAACSPGAGMDVVLRKAKILGAADGYSHFRAIATYFEAAGDRRAVPVLAKLLRTKGIGGHACAEGTVPEIPNYSNVASNIERSDVLRELCLVRALFRLGDTDDALGRRTLEAYARDPRGAFAAHARLVLKR